jgi:hypothetical protein
MKRVTLISLALLVIAGSQARADQSVQLRVTATIPPRPCDYPDRCDPVPAQMKNVVTSVTVADESIRYVGSPPAVTVKDGVKTVIF